MADTLERILSIASYEKGQDFMRQCAELGVRVTLLTVEKLRDADWPRDVLEDVATMPGQPHTRTNSDTVSWMSRGRRFDRVIALDEFDLENAAAIREHMRLPGMGVTTSGILSRQAGHAHSGSRVWLSRTRILRRLQLR